MAISERKTNQYLKKKPVMRVDRDLSDVLNAGKRNGKMNFTYRQGKSIIPVIEPLIIEKNSSIVSYEDVHERSVQYAKEHEDAKSKLENKKKVDSEEFLKEIGKRLDAMV